MQVLTLAKGEVVALGFTPGWPALVAAVVPAGAFVCSLSSAEPPFAISLSYFRPTSLTFSPDGMQLIKSESSGRVAVDLADGKQTPLGPGSSISLSNFAQSADGSRLVLIHGPFYTPRLSGWRMDGSWVEDWFVEPGEGALTGFALSQGGEWFAHFTRGSQPRWPWNADLKIRNARTGAELATGKYPYAYSSRLMFRPDGTQLLGVHEMTLLMWPIPTGGKPLVVRNDSRRHFTAAAYHPSSRYLFTASNDATVVVWDTTTWQHVTRFTWNIGRLRSIAVSPDGTLAAAGSTKGQVVIWDVDL
jgi:WD40 repeat protein